MGCSKPLRILAVAGIEPDQRPDTEDCIRCRDNAVKALKSLGHQAIPMDIAPWDLEDLPALGDKILRQGCHCVLNFFEGFSDSPEQEVSFASFLEDLKMPFTGNSSETLGLCLNKEKVRERLVERGVPVPPGISVIDGADPRLKELPFPLFLKPTEEDGSVGIGSLSLVSNEAELALSISKMLHDFPKGVTVESFIEGAEYSVGLMGEYPYLALPVSCINYDLFPKLPPYLGYDSKWDVTSPSYSISPSIGEVEPWKEAQLADLARSAGQAMNCRGPFRVDIRERKGEFFVLDVNPNPDLNDDSGFLRQSRRSGVDLPILMETLVRSALVRELTSMGQSTGAFSPDEVQVLKEVLSSWGDAPDRDYSLLLGEDLGGVWGFVIYGRTAMTDFSWDLYWIVVDKAKQGKGKGKQLMMELESELLRQGERAIIRVETSGQENYRYQRDFYGSTGFDECGRIRDFYHQGDDLVIYCRYLNREGL